MQGTGARRKKESRTANGDEKLKGAEVRKGKVDQSKNDQEVIPSMSKRVRNSLRKFLDHA